MQQSEDIWNREDVQVVVVSFEPASLLSRLASSFPEEWHFVSDPGRNLYEAYGAGLASLPRLLSPRTLWAYLRAVLDGRLFRNGTRGDGEMPDTAQLGGDFVISRHGRVQLAWSSSTPADRPGMEVLRKALRS